MTGAERDIPVEKGDGNDSYESDDSGDEAGGEDSIQLGIVVPLEVPQEELLFRTSDWHSWDGGKAGGWPVWLNPRDIPSPESLRCGECNHPLSFLIQLYCPLDHEDSAFHRCLYVFCCPKGSCSSHSSARVLRCQLPRNNLFYAWEPDDEEEELHPGHGNPEDWGVSLCWVCGMAAKSSCGRCGKARYCSREHQTAHWKRGGHKEVCATEAKRAETPTEGEGGAAGEGREGVPAFGPQGKPTGLVFREFEVEVKPEEWGGMGGGEAVKDRAEERRIAEQLGMASLSLGDEGEEEDSNLSQAELDKIAGVHGTKDKATLKFMARTHGRGQVVRYDPGRSSPLWSSSKGVPTHPGEVPACPQCGLHRKFEFQQVMPHLLHHLGVETGGKAWDPMLALKQGTALPPQHAMDWGTLAIYTCPKSCNPKESMVSCGGKKNVVGGTLPGYVEEFVWRQPPP
ncbi:unnamed protein product [Discosporangium mesarthrocarpum]